MRKIIGLILAILAMVLPGSGIAAEKAGQATHERETVLTFFWGQGCPHCEHEKAFLAELKKKHSGLVIRDYEVWHNKENAALYKRVLQAAKIKQAGVPCTVVGEAVFIGFSEQTRKGIENAVERCIVSGCPDVVGAMSGQALSEAVEETVSIPLLGQIDPDRLSLPVFTIIIAGLDSFNPCAFFVLLFLLSLMVHARSRKRMVLIGGVFVLFSGIMYFLFMAAWFSVFLVIGQITLITTTAGLVALVVGGINVKDFLFFKAGVSLSIPESAKPRLFERMRNLVKSQSLPAALTGTVVLAVTANAYELLCTAGFPMVYTRVLTLNKLTTLEYYLYLVFYNIVYVVPLAAIVILFTMTLGSRKLTEWQGRKLKLISGLMMLALGGLLMLKPDLLNNAAASVALLAGVLIASWAVITIARKLKPEIAK